MKLLRSWPAEIPEGRSYVVDGIERFVMDRFDYYGLKDVDDDVCLIEWDIAIGADELAEFMRRAAADPDQVRVAPYLLYPASTNCKAPFYVHRIQTLPRRRYVTGPEDPYCEWFGFGLVYLPRALVLGFVEHLDARPKRRNFSDTTFSHWHYWSAPEHLRRVPIDWDLPACHLHYSLPEVPA